MENKKEDSIFIKCGKYFIAFLIITAALAAGIMSAILAGFTIPPRVSSNK